MVDVNVEKFIYSHVITFILFLYGNPNLPRNIVQDIIEHLDNLLKNVILPCLRTQIFRSLEKRNELVNQKLEIEKHFQDYSSIFEQCNTEHKIFNCLEKSHGFSFPENFFVGTSFFERDIEGVGTRLEADEKHGICIPLGKSLKCFLEKPGIFDSIMDYVGELGVDKVFIKNFVQGSLWREFYLPKEAFDKRSGKKDPDSVTLPLTVYFDEFVAGNALGSHASATKFGAVYAFISCLPPVLSSKLISILFSTLFYAKDLSVCSYNNIFSKLVNDLNNLSGKGITISFGGIVKHIYFQCVMIIGDNLGLNSIFNFSASFNQDNCCRICRASLQEIREMVKENETLLRTPINHNQYFLKKNVFDALDFYHVTINCTCDIMHDLLEGVAVYDMLAILNYYVFEKKYFTLNYLNTRIEKMKNCFGANMPPIIKLEADKKSVKIKMSAAELKSFVHYFPFIIGDKILKESDKDSEIWELYKHLRNIVDLVHAPIVTTTTASHLKKIIEKHHKLYKKYFGDLKPKHHFLLHYPNIMLKNGPLVHFWCMRCESRHRTLKAAANATSGNKNSLLSIGIKEVLRMCYEKDCYKSIDDISFGKEDFDLCSAEVLSSIKGDIMGGCIFYKNIEIQGTKFKIGDVIIIDLENIEVTFGLIEKIIAREENIFFTFKLLKEDYYDDEFQAYLVVEKINRITIAFESLPDFAPCSLHKQNEKLYVILPHAM